LTSVAVGVTFSQMVNSRSAPLDETFFALSDPTRRAIVASLAEGESSVADLAKPFRLSAPAISKHLRVLERADLVRQRREGRIRRCRLNPGPLREASDYVAAYRRFWGGQFDRLDDYLRQTAPSSGPQPNSEGSTST